MTPAHHPDPTLLVTYAAGNLPEPVALLVATHDALCPACRGQVEQLEAVGGVLLEERCGAATVSETVLERVLERLDAPAQPEAVPEPARACRDLRVPRPLRDYLSASLEALPWRRVTGSISQCRLLEGSRRYRARLMRVSPGASMPQHTHQGLELTLILAGTMIDADITFARGDVATADADVDHRPMAGTGEHCICLAVTDAPVRLSGRFTRFLNPFVDF